jgi:membrane-bound lytic murein transglycosylase A
VARRAGALLLLLLTISCTGGNRPPPAAIGRLTAPSGLGLQPVNFADLPDWYFTASSAALAAFRRSCAQFSRLADDTAMGPGGFAGRVSDWRIACRAADALGPAAGDDEARRLFQQNFIPYRLSDAAGAEAGLLTGYYLPEVRGARRRSAEFSVPLYRRPPDLVAGPFGSGQYGRLVGGQFQPYYTRAEIDAGSLSGRGLELVWLASPIDAFFVSIQGSANVALNEGGVLRIGVAASNGRAYVAIGRLLIEQGEIKPEDMSLQSLKAWLTAHPDRARDLMERNPRYIFFQENPGEGPVGTEGVVLTPGASLAVDPAYLPLGAPVFIDAADAKGQTLRRLMLAQDSGAAIKGALRGDVYWGSGSLAESNAGVMKSQSRFYLLLPVGLNPAGGG